MKSLTARRINGYGRRTPLSRKGESKEFDIDKFLERAKPNTVEVNTGIVKAKWNLKK